MVNSHKFASRCCVLAIATLFLILSGIAQGHDLQGLLAPRSLPEDVQQQIGMREKIRNAADPALLDPSLGPEQRKKLLRAKGLPESFESLESVVSARALWPQHTKLLVCFFDGGTVTRQQVLTIFQAIVDETNLSLDTTVRQCPDPDAQIRVSFAHAGYSSYVGTDALLIPSYLPTMSLQNLDLSSQLTEQDKGNVRHEFMHAVGALHEHQHPATNCADQLNWPLVASEFHWSDEQMQVAFRQLIFDSSVIAGPYDKKSIMHYQIAPRYWKSGAKSSCYIPFQNTSLSEADKDILHTVYPK